jgi:hypothetical protein
LPVEQKQPVRASSIAALRQLERDPDRLRQRGDAIRKALTPDVIARRSAAIREARQRKRELLLQPKSSAA